MIEKNNIKRIQEDMPHTWVLLKKMFDMVGAPYKLLEKHRDWYLKYSWSQAQEDEFREFFVDYLYNNAEARHEIMNYPSKTKKAINKVFSCFNLNYGWHRNDLKLEELK